MIKRLVYSLLLLGQFCAMATAQELGGRHGFGISASYAPTSNHILIGHAEGRRTLSAGVEYDRALWANSHIGLTYKGSLTPLFRESDPTMIGTSTASILGPPTITYFPKPIRVLTANNAPLGYELGGGTSIPIEPIYGPRESTYALAISPLGVKLNALRHRRVQPTMSFDFGVLYASRSIPIDHATRFNYVFSLGPGLEVFRTSRSAILLEYLYRHISNADEGTVNAGIDSGVFKLTYTYYRK